MDIYGLEKLSLVDFDGYVSATIFTGGCNFRCPFCHNSPLVLSHKDLGTIPESEVLEYLIKRKNILEGVCISGGEPTLNNDLPLFIEKVKTLGYKVKLDTNGTNPEMVKSLYNAGLVDYFAMDIKNDKENYSSIVGIDNFSTKKVEKTVEFFLGGGAPYEFRTTLIKEFHTKSNILGIANWIKGADKYFLQKFKNSGTCIKSHLSAVEDKVALSFRDILLDYIPSTRLRGYDI